MSATLTCEGGTCQLEEPWSLVIKEVKENRTWMMPDNFDARTRLPTRLTLPTADRPNLRRHL